MTTQDFNMGPQVDSAEGKNAIVKDEGQNFNGNESLNDWMDRMMQNLRKLEEREVENQQQILNLQQEVRMIHAKLGAWQNSPMDGPRGQTETMTSEMYKTHGMGYINYNGALFPARLIKTEQGGYVYEAVHQNYYAPAPGTNYMFPNSPVISDPVPYDHSQQPGQTQRGPSSANSGNGYLLYNNDYLRSDTQTQLPYGGNSLSTVVNENSAGNQQVGTYQNPHPAIKLEKQCENDWNPKSPANKEDTKGFRNSSTSGGKPTRCAHCTRVFYFNHALVLHTRSCKRRHEAYMKHLAANGKGDAKNVKACGKNEDSLKRFEDVKMIQCNYCDRLFPTLHQVTSHEKVHTKERPYTCYVCRSSFSHAGNLIKHLKKKHPGRNAYTCRMCELNFETHEEVRTHRKFSCNGRVTKAPTTRGLISNERTSEESLVAIRKDDNVDMSYAKENHANFECLSGTDSASEFEDEMENGRNDNVDKRLDI